MKRKIFPISADEVSMANCVQKHVYTALGLLLGLMVTEGVTYANLSSRLSCSWVFGDKSLRKLIAQRNDKSPVKSVAYRERRRLLEENLPAYAKDVPSIFYAYDLPGFKLTYEEGPYTGKSEVNPKKLEIRYDPSKFIAGSIFRRAFGETAMILDESALKAKVSNQVVSEDEGHWVALQFHAMDPNASQGPKILISRDTGKIRLMAPARDDQGFLQNLSKELLDDGIHAMWNRSKTPGDWYTDRNIIDLTETQPGSFEVVKP